MSLMDAKPPREFPFLRKLGKFAAGVALVFLLGAGVVGAVALYAIFK